MQGLTGAENITPLRLGNTASAASLTLPTGPYIGIYPITGTTTITSIAAGLSGQIAILEFASAGCQVTNGSNLKLVTDYISTAYGELTLEYDGANWVEQSRTSWPTRPLNVLPNGEFIVWQRGTSFAALANAGFAADMWRWQNNIAGAGVVTVSRDTSVPSVAANAINTPYSLKVAVATADTSIAAGEIYGPYTVVEGYDYRALTNGFALSFWVKAHRTGTYCVAFLNKGDRTYVGEYTISAADTWEYKTIVVPTPPTAGSWGYTNDQGLLISFTMAVGSTYQTTAGAWQTGAFYGSANQVNGVGATTDTFSLALVNLIPGPTALPLVPAPYALSFERCQRYYQFIHPTINYYCGDNANAYGTWVPFSVEMGGTPTMTKVGTFSNTNVASTNVQAPNVGGCNLYIIASAAGRATSSPTSVTADGYSAEWNP